MKRGMLLGLALLLALSTMACNTVRGVGRDIEASGRAIQKATH
ncbi:MAG: entericidin A/B family lipoprotein [Azoarcus sp.]|jgi:predicted small secreted protein|nr:entericidin A/B family lipoprotein [Azoarcus sp.]